MAEPTCWLCAVCGRYWVTGLRSGLATGLECGHDAEVRLPVLVRDESDALRFLARVQKKLEGGLTHPPRAPGGPEDP